MSHGTWQPAEEKPAFEGQPVPVWLCLSGDRIFPGEFIEEVAEPDKAAHYVWKGDSGHHYTMDEVEYWRLREPGESVPEMPY